MPAIAPKTIAANALFTGAAALFYANPAGTQALPAHAAPPAPWAPAGAEAALQGLRLAGEGTLRYLGFEVYRARLWVPAGFDAADYAARPLALELTYHRSFTADAIAQRSLEEMRRVGAFTPEQAQRWLRALQAVLPDVRSGDRLVGVYLPGQGAVFRSGGRVLGRVDDAEFARLFFGIWLSPQTSEPGLRQALVGDTARVAGRP